MKIGIWFGVICILIVGLIVLGIVSGTSGSLARVCKTSNNASLYIASCPEICWEASLPLIVSAKKADKDDLELLDAEIKWINTTFDAKMLALGTENAQVEIFFNQAAEMINPKEGGETTHWFGSGDCVTSAKVRMINVPLIENARLTLRHELGHVLGLADDDQSTNSVMHVPISKGDFFDADIALIRGVFRL